MTLSLRPAVLALAAAATLAACSSVTVNTDWNTNLDFTQYKTYAWLPDTVDKDLSPFAQHKDGLDGLSKDRVWHAHYHCRRNLGQFTEHVFHLFR